MGEKYIKMSNMTGNITPPTAVLVTGGFDPIHSGHIEYFKQAKKLGDKFIIGLNSDEWLKRKKGRFFMPFEERKAILENLKDVRAVIAFDDSDDTANAAIEAVLEVGHDVVTFANGGDRNETNIPEYEKFENHPFVKFAWNVGGGKKNSSSWILQEWKEPKTERAWGYYRVIYEAGDEVKVKELTVQPGKQLSMQRHKERAEHWFVYYGKASVYTLNVSSDMELDRVYNAHESLHIDKGKWHMLANETQSPLKIIEIQYGTKCIEEDIERVALLGYD